MRRKEREITSLAEMEEIIGKAVCCRVGLADGGEPYVVPVNFGYERNTLYFHGAGEGQKISILKKNNRVCFEVEADVELVRGEEPCRWTTRYRSVIGMGNARILESDEEKRHGLAVITRHYAGGMDESYFQFPQARLDKTTVVRVDIESMTGKKSGY